MFFGGEGRFVSEAHGRWPAPAIGERPSFLEFFAGNGLVAQGLGRVFRAVWANDIDAKKAAVYQANHGGSHFHCGSIADVHGQALPAAPLAWASFPCQDLSLAGLTGKLYKRLLRDRYWAATGRKL